MTSDTGSPTSVFPAKAKTTSQTAKFCTMTGNTIRVVSALKNGGAYRNRTCDHLIKSQMLYQLS